MKARGLNAIGVGLLLVGVLLAGAARAGAASCTGIPAWTDCCGCAYSSGQKVTYQGSLYQAAQTFTNTCTAGWTPSAAHSLWTLTGACTATPTVTRTSTPTATATRTPTPTQATPAAVTGLVGANVTCGWRLTWNPAAGAVSYDIKRSTTAGGPYSVYRTGITGTTYSDGSPVSHFFVVTGVNATGEGPASNEVRVSFFDCSTPTRTATATSGTPTRTAQPTSTATPANVRVAVNGVHYCDGSQQMLMLQWDTVPPYLGSNAFTVGFSATSGGPYDPRMFGGQPPNPTTTVGMDGLIICTTVGNSCVSYIAVATGGAWSKEARGEIVTLPCATPAPPLPEPGPMPATVTGLAATVGADNCDGSFKPTVLSWNPVPGALYYYVYRAETGSGQTEPLIWYLRESTLTVPLHGAADYTVSAFNGTTQTPDALVQAQWAPAPSCPNPPPAPPAWQGATAYTVGRAVTYGGAAYVCTHGHASAAGLEPPSAPAYWVKR
jgi:hypothetical protein